MLKLPRLSIVLLAASTALSAQTFTVIYNFSTTDVAFEPYWPGAIAQSRGGAMFSTTESAAFKIWPDGSFQNLYQYYFEIHSGLTLGRDGWYYGTTTGANNENFWINYGTIFKMSTHGSVTTLYEFQGGSEGNHPSAAPIQSQKGDLYGTTRNSVYRITTGGKFTLLHTFTGSDGANSIGPLVQGTDLYFYGTTQAGGTKNLGTIFRVSRSGDFKVLFNFDGTHGKWPLAGLIEANDGNLYGVSSYGGSSAGGTLFRMKPSGTLTVLHNFTGGSDGANPQVGLVQASDGNLYGATEYGGKNGWGVLFRATLTGDVVPLHDFGYNTEADSALFQHTNGKIYGDTSHSDKSLGGYFYCLDAGLPPFVIYLPTYGRAGASVEILGQGFTAGSQVFFNGTPAASPVVVYPTFLKAVVPSGATTGPITVTTSTGTLTSNKVFVVHP